MLDRIRRSIREAFGYRYIDILDDQPSILKLAYGPTTTTFDRGNAMVLQNGRLVAMADLIEKIELHQPQSQDGPVNWFVTVHVRGARKVEVGRITDSTDASLIAARISAIVGKPVVLGR